MNVLCVLLCMWLLHVWFSTIERVWSVIYCLTHSLCSVCVSYSIIDKNLDDKETAEVKFKEIGEVRTLLLVV